MGINNRKISLEQSRIIIISLILLNDVIISLILLLWINNNKNIMKLIKVLFDITER